jgi:hypothetical protein
MGVLIQNSKLAETANGDTGEEQSQEIVHEELVLADETDNSAY